MSKNWVAKITILTGKLTDVGKHVLQTICELESIHIAQTELDVRVDDQFSQSQDFSNQMEGVSESRLLSFLGRLSQGQHGSTRADWANIPES